jgi:nucleotide-binding universal stress UspA family protein
MDDTVVVGYDRSPSGDLALDVAAREAARRGVPLTVLTAYSWPAGTSPTAASVVHEALGGPAELDARHGAQRVADRHPGLTVRHLARPGFPWDVLATASEGAARACVGSPAVAAAGSRSARSPTRCCVTQTVRWCWCPMADQRPMSP